MSRLRHIVNCLVPDCIAHTTLTNMTSFPHGYESYGDFQHFTLYTHTLHAYHRYIPGIYFYCKLYNTYRYNITRRSSFFVPVAPPSITLPCTAKGDARPSSGPPGQRRARGNRFARRVRNAIGAPQRHLHDAPRRGPDAARLSAVRWQSNDPQADSDVV